MEGSESEATAKYLKDELLAARMQSEEQQAEIERLREEKSSGGNLSMEERAKIEASIEMRVRKSVLSELAESEERQRINLSIVTRKLDKPFKKFKWAGDERFYGNVQEIKNKLEIAYFQLESETEVQPKTREAFEDLANTIQSVEDDIVTAQVSRHGWATVDRYHDRKEGFKFIGDPDKAKELKEMERELDKERKFNGGASKKFGGMFPMQSGPSSHSTSPVRGGSSPVRQSSPVRGSAEGNYGARRTGGGDGVCVWCSSSGHFYRHCPKFNQDVKDGNARYDPNTRRWTLATKSR